MDNIIPEDFNPEPEEQHPALKVISNIFFGVMAVFIAFLFISYFVPGNSLTTYFQGRTASATIEDYQVDIKGGGIVVFEPEVYNKLLAIYEEEQEHEFKVCLHGRKEGADYFVDGLSVPTLFSQSVFSVSAAQCDNTTVISLHSHPFRSCVPSSQDLRSQQAFKQINPDSIGGLICENNRFTFYG